MRLAAPAIEPRQEVQFPESKESELRGLMRKLGTVLVAYSGGVDSSYLAKIATEELADRALCVMGISPSVSEHQRIRADQVAAAHGFRLESVNTSEFDDPNYIRNSSNRCYFCKSELYSRLQGIASEYSIEHVLDGTNADDLRDHRPGREAAREHSVLSPLAELGFTKQDIRDRSRLLGLATWDEPASPCLSSRIAHGVPVTIERLSAVERGEDFLRRLGFREFRVRVHGELVRLEIAPGEMVNVLNTDMVRRVSDEFKRLGFRYVTLDLNGFRSGSMNENN